MLEMRTKDIIREKNRVFAQNVEKEKPKKIPLYVVIALRIRKIFMIGEKKRGCARIVAKNQKINVMLSVNHVEKE
jgi:uncharacterized pyridoxamine 5'-phosphate oxidase family protein